MFHIFAVRFRPFVSLHMPPHTHTESVVRHNACTLMGSCTNYRISHTVQQATPLLDLETDWHVTTDGLGVRADLVCLVDELLQLLLVVEGRRHCQVDCDCEALGA